MPWFFWKLQLLSFQSNVHSTLCMVFFVFTVLFILLAEMLIIATDSSREQTRSDVMGYQVRTSRQTLNHNFEVLLSFPHVYIHCAQERILSREIALLFFGFVRSILLGRSGHLDSMRLTYYANVGAFMLVFHFSSTTLAYKLQLTPLATKEKKKKK